MTSRPTTVGVLAAAALMLAGCSRERPAVAPARVASARPPATRVDSALPREVTLARFQHASERASALSGGASSRDALVRAFVRAVEARDTSALRQMVLSRGEFAYLYYPTSAQGLPPYSLSPDLLWFLTVEHSNRGVSALLDELGGKGLRYAGYRCEGDSAREGENILWGPCLVRSIQAPGDTVARRLFGPILAHRGRYKFLDYSNKL